MPVAKQDTDNAKGETAMTLHKGFDPNGPLANGGSIIMPKPRPTTPVPDPMLPATEAYENSMREVETYLLKNPKSPPPKTAPVKK